MKVLLALFAFIAVAFAAPQFGFGRPQFNNHQFGGIPFIGGSQSAANAASSSFGFNAGPFGASASFAGAGSSAFNLG